MSGQRPWNTACYTNGDFWTRHIKEDVGLSAQFLKAGYDVAGAGKIYHSDSYYESERTNLTGDRQYADVIREHARWLPKTNAALAKGGNGVKTKKARKKVDKSQ